ncbi:hypothetical protein [Aestuariivivens sediminis]|uniref:hypothetical protein n=1 Tax=Aestuariivivens sediminis TaxID=2913557 RepID=UPI001F5A9E91|nr:hypothetical protein [Aestuariivivens sediminis]
MNKNSVKEHQLSRRGFLPILGGSLLLPFFGMGSPNDRTILSPDEEDYQTLLKPDGTTVKVKVSTLKKSKIIKKDVSNTSLLKWLGKKQ